MYANYLARIRVNKSFNSLIIDLGEFKNLYFFKNDCHNYINNVWQLQLEKSSARALRQNFCKIQVKNNQFFTLMDINDDKRLLNLFWVIACSRITYKYFENVVTFNTTYLTNWYRIPFALFVDENYYGQSIFLRA